MQRIQHFRCVRHCTVSVCVVDVAFAIVIIVVIIVVAIVFTSDVVIVGTITASIVKLIVANSVAICMSEVSSQTVS